MLYPRMTAPLAATLQLFHPVTAESVEAAIYALSAPLSAILIILNAGKGGPFRNPQNPKRKTP